MTIVGFSAVNKGSIKTLIYARMHTIKILELGKLTL